MKKDKEITVHSDAKGIENFEKAVAEEVKASGVEIPENVDIEAPLSDEEALAQMPTNIPYRKIFNDEGELVNPITKGNPYLMPFMNRRQKKALIRQATRHPKNNKKGIRLIVTPFAKGKFTKTEVVRQRIERGIEANSTDEDGNIVVGTKVQKARTIIHNKMKLRNEQTN